MFLAILFLIILNSLVAFNQDHGSTNDVAQTILQAGMDDPDPGPGTRTLDGFFNIALRKSVTLSTVYDDSSNGSMAVNGIKTGRWEDGCASTTKETNPWMLLDLGTQYSIYAVYILNRSVQRERLSSLHIEIGNLTDNLTEVVYHHDPIGADIIFILESVQMGHFLKFWLEKTEFLTVCKIEVYCGIDSGDWNNWSQWNSCTKSCGNGTMSRSRSCNGSDCCGTTKESTSCNTNRCPGYLDSSINVALEKYVSLSTVYDDGATGSTAVNGITSGIWEDGCASTKEETNPWMLLDLGAQYSISEVYILNRKECSQCGDRLSRLHIEVGNLADNLTEIVYHHDPIGAHIMFILDPARLGQFIKFWLEKTEFLTICEIEVYCDQDSGNWTYWSQWSSCTKSCGNGTASRSRLCYGADCCGTSKETVACNTHECPGQACTGVWTVASCGTVGDPVSLCEVQDNHTLLSISLAQLTSGTSCEYFSNVSEAYFGTGGYGIQSYQYFWVTGSCIGKFYVCLGAEKSCTCSAPPTTTTTATTTIRTTSTTTPTTTTTKQSTTASITRQISFSITKLISSTFVSVSSSLVSTKSTNTPATTSEGIRTSTITTSTPASATAPPTILVTFSNTSPTSTTIKSTTLITTMGKPTIPFSKLVSFVTYPKQATSTAPANDSTIGTTQETSESTNYVVPYATTHTTPLISGGATCASDIQNPYRPCDKVDTAVTAGTAIGAGVCLTALCGGAYMVYRRASCSKISPALGAGVPTNEEDDEDAKGDDRRTATEKLA